MCGGLAYVLDEQGGFRNRVNHERVLLEELDEEDLEVIQRMVRRHFEYTRSARADDILRKWDTFAPKFVKVYPREYKAALAAMAADEI